MKNTKKYFLIALAALIIGTFIREKRIEQKLDNLENEKRKVIDLGNIHAYNSYVRNPEIQRVDYEIHRQSQLVDSLIKQLDKMNDSTRMDYLVRKTQENYNRLSRDELQNLTQKVANFSKPDLTLEMCDIVDSAKAGNLLSKEQVATFVDNMPCFFSSTSSRSQISRQDIPNLLLELYEISTNPLIISAYAVAEKLWEKTQDEEAVLEYKKRNGYDTDELFGISYPDFDIPENRLIRNKFDSTFNASLQAFEKHQSMKNRRVVLSENIIRQEMEKADALYATRLSELNRRIDRCQNKRRIIK
ncbi:MAG: hypothetical protein FWG80_02060 [Alphaproteobacteria bacterium]|nr:hypothetical protein [Alphaproteobacteria bacterium]